MPVIIYNTLQSARLLTDSIDSFNKNLLIGLKPNYEKIDYFLKNSLMLVTALSPYIGYDKASSLAKYAHKEKITLKEANLKLNYLSEEEFDRLTDPKNMI